MNLSTIIAFIVNALLNFVAVAGLVAMVLNGWNSRPLLITWMVFYSLGFVSYIACILFVEDESSN